MREIDKRAIKYQMYMVLDRILEEGPQRRNNIFGRFLFVVQYTMNEQEQRRRRRPVND